MEEVTYIIVWGEGESRTEEVRKGECWQNAPDTMYQACQKAWAELSKHKGVKDSSGDEVAKTAECWVSVIEFLTRDLVWGKLSELHMKLDKDPSVIGYRRITIDPFKQIREELKGAGLIPATCREVSPYYYSANGSGRKERSPGHVAIEVRRLAKVHGYEGKTNMWPCSWAGTWPRTVSSIRTEREGAERFWFMVEFLIEKGVLADPLTGKRRSLAQEVA